MSKHSPFRFAANILVEDADLLVLAKPAGISTLAERTGNEPNLLDLGRAYCPTLQVCHRLDKQTTGALLFAKTPDAYRALTQQFEKRVVVKVYWALLNGHPPVGDGVAITAPLAVNPKGIVRADFKTGKPAETRFRLEATYPTVTLVAAKPITGRSHQIRVHAAFMGHPLVGDTLYGGTDLKLSDFKKGYKGDRYDEAPLNHGFLLHATSLTFHHPATGAEMTAEAPLPDHFAAVLKVLAKWST